MKKIILIVSAFLFVTQTVNSKSLDLSSFLELVRKNNKDIIIANQELEIAEQNKREASSFAWPQLSAEGSYNKNLKDAR